MQMCIQRFRKQAPNLRRGRACFPWINTYLELCRLLSCLRMVSFRINARTDTHCSSTAKLTLVVAQTLSSSAASVATEGRCTNCLPWPRLQKLWLNSCRDLKPHPNNFKSHHSPTLDDSQKSPWLAPVKCACAYSAAEMLAFLLWQSVAS